MKGKIHRLKFNESETKVYLDSATGAGGLKKQNFVSIDTSVGMLTFDPFESTVEQIKLDQSEFTDKLIADMQSFQNRIIDKSLKLTKVLFLSSSDLVEMLKDNDAEAFIFYQTDGGEASTFTVVSADRGLTPNLLARNGKWKLKVTLADAWPTPHPIKFRYPLFRNFDITNIFNPILPAYSHRFESEEEFFMDLRTNSKEILSSIDSGSLPFMRIAVILKDDLESFANTQKYKGMLIYLNYSAQDRIVPVKSVSNEIPTRMRFASLSTIGVDQNWEPLAEINEKKMTLTGFCPPDCPIYNNNI